MDPFLGRLVGGRYEIRELLGVGGMGRVYAAMHLGLDRMVAVKFIHPKQLANRAAVQRFMLEARAASRLSHPHVVAIHDFGGGARDDDELYLVMELLEGPSLGDELRGEPMPIARSVDILCQILSALHEAHHRGITHRDIKPENILLTPRPVGDHVKIIDFGVARVHAGSNLTQPGEVVGTPRYMAPEQTRGEPAGPAADLYAVGVLMFHMLTGQRAFNGKAASEVVAQILSVRRPDPCAVAPERCLPAPLAAVCIRAMALDPAARYPTAEAFARAIVDAVGEPWSAARALLFAAGGRSAEPSGAAPAPLSARVLESRRDRPAVTPTEAPTPSPTPGPLSAPLSAPVLGPMSGSELHRPTLRMPRVSASRPLVGRTADLAWAREQLVFTPGGACLALCGRAGIGRTRLLAEVAGMARQMGADVIRMAPGPPPPLGEVSGNGLRGMVIRILAGSSVAAAEPPEMTDLRRLFVDAPTAETSASPRRTHVAALRWAMESAVAAARGRVLLEMDDVDGLDGVSQAALAGALEGPPIPGLVVAVTSEQRTGRWAPAHAATRMLTGLSTTDAAEVVRRHGDARLPRFGHAGGDIEPLYLELHALWWDGSSKGAAPPAHLAGLVQWRLEGLSPLELRITQALAVMGRPDLDALAAVLDHPGALDAPLAALDRARLVARDQGFAWLRHASFGRVAVALTPPATLVALHARAAAKLGETQRRAELCAYHALRGRPDLDALLLVEESAQLRLALDDQEGAIRLLGEGFRAARALVLAGELDAATWWAPMGRRFGAMLGDAGRLDEAHGVLAEVLEHTDRRKLEHARVAEQLARIAERRGRAEESLALLREALEVAEALNDDSLAARLRFSVGTGNSGIRRTPSGRPLSEQQRRKTGGDRTER